MKILMLFPYAPLPPPLDLAGTKRNLPFLLELAKYHSISVLSYGTHEEESMFRNAYEHMLKEVYFVNRKRPRILNGLERAWLLATGRSDFRTLYRASMQQAIDTLTARTDFDLIHCCVPFFGYFKFPNHIPVTSDTHEVKHELLYRTAKQSRHPLQRLFIQQSAKLGKPEEVYLCNKFDLIIATTQRDASAFRRNHIRSPIEVIENGAGDSFFEGFSSQEEPESIVFTGLFTHIPNQQGIHWMLKEILPIVQRKHPNVKLYVVGKDPPANIMTLASDKVIVTGFVDDVRPYMAKAAAYVIPLKSGGGIRGKALEAMAMRKAIVTTHVGVEGIDLTHNESALFADDSIQFGKEIIRIFENPALGRRLGQQAYTTACQKYRWVSKGRDLSDALEKVVAQKALEKNVKRPVRSTTSTKTLRV